MIKTAFVEKKNILKTLTNLKLVNYTFTLVCLRNFNFIEILKKIKKLNKVFDSILIKIDNV